MALRYSSSSDFLEKLAPILWGPVYSVSLWFKTSDNTKDAYLFNIADRLAVPAPRGRESIFWNATAGFVEYSSDSSGLLPGFTCQRGAIANDTWYHVAAIANSASSHFLYVNGAFTQDVTNSADQDLNVDSTGIGLFGDVTQSFNDGGQVVDIAHVAVFNRALSAGDITLLYTNLMSPRYVTGLQAYWTDDGVNLEGNANYNLAQNGTSVEADPPGIITLPRATSPLFLGSLTSAGISASDPSTVVTTATGAITLAGPTVSSAAKGVSDFDAGEIIYAAATGCAGKAMDSVVNTIPELDTFQKLMGQPNATQSIPFVVAGVMDEPSNFDAFMRQELESMKGYANVYGATEDGYAAATGLALGHVNSVGQITIHLRRYLDDSDIAKIQTAYRWFYDLSTEFAKQLVDTLESTGRLVITQVPMTVGPFISDEKDEEDLARYIWAEYELAWSDQPLEQ